MPLMRKLTYFLIFTDEFRNKDYKTRLYHRFNKNFLETRRRCMQTTYITAQESCNILRSLFLRSLPTYVSVAWRGRFSRLMSARFSTALIRNASRISH